MFWDTRSIYKNQFYFFKEARANKMKLRKQFNLQ